MGVIVLHHRAPNVSQGRVFGTQPNLVSSTTSVVQVEQRSGVYVCLCARTITVIRNNL